MLTLITCTGHRSAAFVLCVDYVKAQTYKQKLQWIVINDDAKSADLKPLFKSLPGNVLPELYQGPENWRPGVNTHKGNVEQALDKVKGDKILFIEDDDYYAPTYLEVMDSFLDASDIAGEANACYYNIKIPGWRRMQNYNQASLAQTGIRASLLPALKSALKMDGNIDGNLWEVAHKQGVKGLLVTDYNLCIGMKGLPGRPGIGVGHLFKDYLPDPNLSILRKWLGLSALPYIALMKQFRGGKKDEKVENGKVQTQDAKVTKPPQAGKTSQAPKTVASGKTQIRQTGIATKTKLDASQTKVTKATEIAHGVSK